MHIHASNPITLLPAALGAAVLLFTALSHLRKSGRYLCPGPRTPLVRFLNPLNWLLKRPCGYDLRGLPRTPSNLTTCPECARASLPHQAIRKARRWRPTGFGLLLIAATVTTRMEPFFGSGRFTTYLPNTPLLALARIPARFRPHRVNSELDVRRAAGILSQRQTRWLVSALVADLHDDSAAGNASQALGSLIAIGRAAVPALLAGLDSPDWQQRQLAASVLRDLDQPPTDALLRVTVEGLHDDDLPFSKSAGTATWVSNGREGIRYLIEHADVADPYLLVGLTSDDAQQRLMSAVVAGFAGRTGLIPLAVPVLLQNLRDDGTWGNAIAATAALGHFGPAAAPWIMTQTCSPDPQQRRMARLILVDLLAPPATPADFALRSSLQPITCRCDDPAVQLTADELEW